MCWWQEIHEVHCPDLFDVSGQERHVCEKAYPAPAPGAPDLRCPVHSCCRVTTELVSECAAVREARAASTADSEGKQEFSCGDQENSEYREVVFMALDERGGGNGNGDGGKGGPVAWESIADRRRGFGREASEGRWEVLWDAADDEGYAYECASRRGSANTHRTRRSGSGGGGFPDAGDDYDYSDNDDDEDDEDEDAELRVESPYMEFWTFGAGEDSAVGGDAGLYADDATAGGVSGKVFVYFEDPINTYESGDGADGKGGEEKQSEGGRERKGWFGCRWKDGSSGGGRCWWWKKGGATKGVRSS